MFLKETNSVQICLEDYLYLEEGFNLSNFLEDYIKKLENVKIDKTYISKQKIKYDKLLSDFKSKLSKEEKVILNEKTKEIKNNFKSISKDDILTESEEYMFMKESFIKDKIEKLKGVITKSFLTFDDNVLEGMSIFVVVLIVQIIFLQVLAAIFGINVAMVILIVIVGPILEEVGRYVALKTDSVDSYTSTLNIWEFMTYAVKKANVLVVIFNVISRILVASELHTANATRMKNAMGTDDEIKSLITSTIYHVLWNGIAVVISVLGNVKKIANLTYASVPINSVMGNTIFKL